MTPVGAVIEGLYGRVFDVRMEERKVTNAHMSEIKVATVFRLKADNRVLLSLSIRALEL
jgi:hypothetical protein